MTEQPNNLSPSGPVQVLPPPPWATARPETLIYEFANVQDEEAATRFLKRWGELRDGSDPHECLVYSRKFRQMWPGAVRESREGGAVEAIERTLEEIFERPRIGGGDYIYGRPAIRVNWREGRLGIKPRNFLDYLAMSLLILKDKLRICARGSECPTPYFVAKPKQKYCSADCFAIAQRETKERWWGKNRKKYIEKWRAQRRNAAQARKSRKKR